MTNNYSAYGAKIIAEFFTNLAFFPFWWYTKGLIKAFNSAKKFLMDQEKSLGLFVWIKNVFTPMYGETDWQGKLISFIMRVVQIIFRSCIMTIYLFVAVLILMTWMLLPIVTIYQIFFQLFG